MDAAPLDAPATPVEVVRNLSALTRELHNLSTAYRVAEHDAALKRHAASMVESRAFLAADGSMELRKHTARVAADRQEQDALVAEALVKVLRNSIREVETRIEVGRSYGATVRAELKTLGYGESA